MGKGRGHLPRLDAGSYRGMACVHWVHTIRDRKMGWLADAFHLRFREILLHTSLRFGLCCPVYCLMPDHMHLVWMGWHPDADQRRATQFFRGNVNEMLGRVLKGTELQRQPYDHVLRDDERRPGAFEVIAAYVAANPIRAGIVRPDQGHEYPYSGCMVPGYPDLSLWDTDYWKRFWRVCRTVVEKNGSATGGM